MNPRRQAVPAFTIKLLSWYKKNARDLPWRRTKDPYRIWISEVMLQQTTVNAVIPYFDRWLKVFPDIQSVAKAPLQKVLKAWQGLGYYARARNLQAAAKIICHDHGGRIPDEVEALRRLPGFGPYTVGAVLSIAFEQRQPIIDANVRRVLMRQFAYAGAATAVQDKKILEQLEKLMPYKEMSFFNQALMELGALVCRNREPLCIICPVKGSCKAYDRGLQELIPEVRKKEIKDVRVVIALIRRGKKYFIQRRPAKGLFADLWEFPGGKIEEGETPEQALARELKEELNVKLMKGKQVFRVKQFYTQFRAELDVWLCEIYPSPQLDETHRWVSVSDFTRYPMPSGSARIVDKLNEIV